MPAKDEVSPEELSKTDAPTGKDAPVTGPEEDAPVAPDAITDDEGNVAEVPEAEATTFSAGVGVDGALTDNPESIAAARTARLEKESKRTDRDADASSGETRTTEKDKGNR